MFPCSQLPYYLSCFSEVPTEPVIIRSLPQGVDPLKEGDDVEYTCTSTGGPPPELQFLNPSGNIDASELSLNPDPDGVTLMSASGTSTLTWRTKAKADMHDKFLKCEVLNHVSKSKKFSDFQMIVYCKYV